MSIQIVSGASSDLLTVDATSKAARVTLYDSAGNEIKNPGQLASYCAATSAAVTPPATPTDVFTIAGSGTKTVKVFRMWISTLQTTAGVNSWFILRRSSADTSGTPATTNAIPNDANDASATASVQQWTANPTLGTLVNTTGTVWAGRVNSPAAGTAGIGGNLVTEVDFTTLFGRPLILRGTAQQLAFNFAGAALPSGMTFLAGVSWTEE
jgi:hypothetical protein